MTQRAIRAGEPIAVVEYGTIDFNKYRDYFGYETYNRNASEPACTPSVPTYIANFGNTNHNLWVASIATGVSVGVGSAVQGASRRNRLHVAHYCKEKLDVSNYAAFDDALAWAVNSGASVINVSSGTNYSGAMGLEEKLADYYSFGWGRTIVSAAGNFDEYVNAPATGYNVIAVGNVDDKQTASSIGTILWVDDAVNPGSSWKNPRSAHSDREKPDLAAPATNVAVWKGDSYSDSDVVLKTGTSFAAPLVTGIASQISNVGYQTSYNPALTRAILLATAWQQPESPLITERKAGAGVVNGARAIAAARQANGISVWDSTMNLPQVGGSKVSGFSKVQTPNYAYWGTSQDMQSINAKAGDRIRVSLAWMSDTAYTNYVNESFADLDLLVYGPTGAYETGAMSYDNTSETVQFTASTSGIYRVRVKPWRINFIGAADYMTFWTAVDVLPAALF